MAYSKSTNLDFERNLEEKDILTVYKSIKNKFKKIDIVVISDKHGCDYMKKIDKKFNLKLLYCKDLVSTFKDMGSDIIRFLFSFK